MQPAPPTSVRRLRDLAAGVGPDRWVSLGLFVAFAVLYVRSIDLGSPDILWHNYVFDADVDRVLADAQGHQNAVVFLRHPLFAMTLAWPASLLARAHAGLDLASSLRLIVASVAALGVVMARAVLHRVTGDRWAAALLASAYGLAATTWLLASVPETFALNAAAIAACFVLHDPRIALPRQHPARFAVFVALSAVAVGTTVSNAVYVVLAYAGSARLAETTWRRRAASCAAYGAAVTLLFVALCVLQKVSLSDRVEHATGIVSPLDAAATDGYLDFGRALSIRDALLLVRAIVVDSIVAPGWVVEVVDTASGPNQMIQYGDWRAPAYLGAAFVLGAAVAGLASRRALTRVVREPLAQLAWAYLAFNVVFHYFYRANGQPFIFTIHVVLPIVVLIAHVYAASERSFRRALVAAIPVAIAINGALFLSGVRQALALPCAHRLELVCVAWATPVQDPRTLRGMDRYLASARYSLARGNEALEHRRPDLAAPFLREAVARDAQAPWAERNLGLALLQLGQNGEARQHLARALERDPDDALTRAAEAEARARK